MNLPRPHILASRRRRGRAAVCAARCAGAGSLESVKSPATPSILRKYLEADANKLSVPGVKASENGGISVWLVTS